MKWMRHTDDSKVLRCGCGGWSYMGQPCGTCAVRKARFV